MCVIVCVEIMFKKIKCLKQIIVLLAYIIVYVKFDMCNRCKKYKHYLHTVGFSRLVEFSIKACTSDTHTAYHGEPDIKIVL